MKLLAHSLVTARVGTKTIDANDCLHGIYRITCHVSLRKNYLATNAKNRL